MRSKESEMRVKVGGKVYDGADEPVMVILSDKDKWNIEHMEPEMQKYLSFPDDMNPDEARAFMKVEDEHLYPKPNPESIWYLWAEIRGNRVVCGVSENDSDLGTFDIAWEYETEAKALEALALFRECPPPLKRVWIEGNFELRNGRRRTPRQVFDRYRR